MRVLHVYGGNLYGGIETLLVTMARLRTLCPSLEPEMALCFDGRLSAELRATGTPVHRLPEVRASRIQTVVRARRALTALLSRGRFDCVICHAAWSQALLGASVKRADIPLVFWAHDAVTGKHWTERLARRVRPDLVICNSRYTAASVGNLYPDVPSLVLAYPVSVEMPRLTSTERAAVRASVDTAIDSTVIIQVSRMERWKGHTLLIEALARLRELPWVWWIVGGAQRPEELAYVARLRAAADRLDVADRVRLLGERGDVRQLLAAADIHCQANLGPEPFGITFIEALAAGLPVVTAAMGGALEIVDDSCGILVPPDDVAALAESLRRLIEDPVLRARLSSAGPARAREVSDPATQMRRLSDALHGIRRMASGDVRAGHRGAQQPPRIAL
jgi:glycosyltransferase involved in cell wall biosynthesis